MVKVYFWLSVVLFAIASVVGISTMLSPPQQHGRGMGAALLAAYVALAWVLTAVNLAIAAVVKWLATVRRGRR